jgi:hypothetical protein
LPADFDSAGFERIAKMIFIRLQAANDSGDLNDLRAFTTPEMFAAIKLDLQERGGVAQRTDVVRVDAEVLDVASEADRQIVSVRFHGLIREEENGVACTVRRGLAPRQARRRQPRVGDRRHPADNRRLTSASRSPPPAVADILALGEAMVEFNQTGAADGRLYLQGFGGDTSNFAVAAARQGARVGYVSALGDDVYGAMLRAMWRAEGVDDSGVATDAAAFTASTSSPTTPPAITSASFAAARREPDARGAAAAAQRSPRARAPRLGHLDGDLRTRARERASRRIAPRARPASRSRSTPTTAPSSGRSRSRSDDRHGDRARPTSACRASTTSRS